MTLIAARARARIWVRRRFFSILCLKVFAAVKLFHRTKRRWLSRLVYCCVVIFSHRDLSTPTTFNIVCAKCRLSLASSTQSLQSLMESIRTRAMNALMTTDYLKRVLVKHSVARCVIEISPFCLTDRSHLLIAIKWLLKLRIIYDVTSSGNSYFGLSRKHS